MILHRPKVNGVGAPNPFARAISWETCLRQVVFGAEEMNFEDTGDWRIYVGPDALVFLAEILCGLHSPMIGETEVLGQFRSFFEKNQTHPALQELSRYLPTVYSAVKETREKWLTGNGSHSYGSVVRRKVRECRSLVLWGEGNLGQEILPWIQDRVACIVVSDLRKPRAKFPHIPRVQSPEGIPADAHIIAAPVSDETVADCLSADATRVILDLRDVSKASDPRVVTLSEVFADIESARNQIKEIVPHCQKLLRSRVNEFYFRSQIRPFGWEDLCG